ncbi:hypothetical protein FOXYSP1_19021 [Fusarium oxysporum f. sp. phaseoli]
MIRALYVFITLLPTLVDWKDHSRSMYMMDG